MQPSRIIIVQSHLNRFELTDTMRFKVTIWVIGSKAEYPKTTNHQL